MRPRFAVVALIAALVPAGVTLRAAAFGQREQKPGGAPPLSDVANYRKWTCANPEPTKMQSRFALLCIGPTADQIARERRNPHVEKWARVYVNDKGAKPFLKEVNPTFPVGTIVVKEKLPAENAAKPELLTVMVKREKGYDPKFGDWEYAVLGGDARTVQARGRLNHCRECHAERARNGYLFRWYRQVKPG